MVRMTGQQLLSFLSPLCLFLSLSSFLFNPPPRPKLLISSTRSKANHFKYNFF